MPAEVHAETARDGDLLRREAAFLDGLVELIGCLDVRTAMQKVADLGHLVIGARTCNVRLLNQNGDAFDLLGTRGATSEEHLRKWRSLECTRSVLGVVFQRRQPYEAKNIKQDPHYEMKEFASKRQLAALRADPVMLNGSVVGVITLYFLSADELTMERRVLANMLARFAAGVLEMQRRDQQWTGSATDALGDPELARARSVEDAASTVARRALAVSACDAASLLLPRGEIGALVGAGGAGHLQLLDHPAVAGLARTAFAMNAAQDSPIEPMDGLLFPGRQANAFPCCVGAQRVGVLMVVSSQEGQLAPPAARSLVYLAARSAEVLLRLQDKERRGAFDEFLATLGVGAQDRLDPDNLRSYLLDFTRRRLGVEGAVLYLWDSDLGRYTPRTARGLKNIRRPIEYAREGYSLDEGFVGGVARQGKTVLLQEPHREFVDADACLTLLRQQTHTRELTLCLGIPIFTQGDTQAQQPVGIAVFADGRPGAGILEGIHELQEAGLLPLAEQVGAMARAQEILERQDRLFHFAAHKAKNPLAKITQAIRAVGDRGWRTADLPLLSKWAEEASRNVTQLLQVWRAISEQPVEAQEVDMTALVTSAIEDVCLMAEARSCTLTVNVQRDCRVLTVESHARDILDNVLDNAIKCSPEPGGIVEVSLRGYGDWYELRVKDNGRGLPRNVRESIIAGSEVQLRPGYGFQRGFGLGLFVVVSYARTLGWQIEVTDCAPSGTSFTFRMPSQHNGLSTEGR